ncbi:MAG: FAD-dependent oxidoreductase [Methylophilaceae bacterium]
MSKTTSLKTTCCIAGGGPAGMMLGYLLTRSGVEVIVLEKHDDFFRDFRGDTIHPSTLELMHELDLLDTFLQQPHQQLSKLSVIINGQTIPAIDFSHLPTKAKFIAMMPQWDFLNFIATQASKLPHFDLHKSTEVTDLIEEDGTVKGVIAKTPQGQLRVLADLVIAADGRSSTVRALSNLKVINTGAPIDVLWFRLNKPQSAIQGALGRIKDSNFMITIDRGSYYQTALIIQKNGFEVIKAKGIAAFRQLITFIEPNFEEVITDIKSWDQVKLLNVQINHLEKWYKPGLLCIGDAAHAMSPMGGVGINLAIQDAVATANILAEKLSNQCCSIQDLAKVQARRTWPTKMTQRLQVMAQRRFFSNAKSNQALSVSKPVAFILKILAPLLRRVLARVVGIGFRAEHIHKK